MSWRTIKIEYSDTVSPGNTIILSSITDEVGIQLSNPLPPSKERHTAASADCGYANTSLYQWGLAKPNPRCDRGNFRCTERALG